MQIPLGKWRILYNCGTVSQEKYQKMHMSFLDLNKRLHILNFSNHLWFFLTVVFFLKIRDGRIWQKKIKKYIYKISCSIPWWSSRSHPARTEPSQPPHIRKRERDAAVLRDSWLTCQPCREWTRTRGRGRFVSESPDLLTCGEWVGGYLDRGVEGGGGGQVWICFV